MEILFALFAMIAFVACVYAYLTGVKHGIRVSSKSVPKPVRDALENVKTSVKQDESTVDDVMGQLMRYSYEEALKATDKIRMGVE